MTGQCLEDWKVRYAPKNMDDDYDDRFVEACQMLDYVEYLADILTVGDLELRTATVKDLMKDGMIGGLEEKVRRDCAKDRQINELIYSCSFLSAHPMKCIHGRFFTVELLIPEDILTLQEYIRALLRLCRKRSI